MISNPTNPTLSKRERSIGWLLVVSIIVLHSLPYLEKYTLPHHDYATVMHMIHLLRNPELFHPDLLATHQLNFFTHTAPLYFYGLALPLSYIFSAKWTLLTIGIVTTAGSAYFAGRSWTKKKHLLVSILITFLLLNSAVSPLEGNRRSFTAFFLLGALWLGKEPDYRGQLLLVLFSAGIYPPVALLVLSYFGIQNLLRYRDITINLSQRLMKLTGLAATFLCGVAPYLWFTFISESSSNPGRIARIPSYDIQSFSRFINNFLVGDIGAIFRDTPQFESFLIGLTRFLISASILKNEFTVRDRYWSLLVASLLLWLLAHLVHPLIYHPFKYTRLSLILFLALPVFENLPKVANNLVEGFRDQPASRYLMWFCAGLTFLVWLAYVNLPGLFFFLDALFLDEIWWRYVFALPTFLMILFFLPGIGTLSIYRSVIAGVVLALMVFPYDYGFQPRQGIRLHQLHGMFNFLRETPPETTVAGPSVFFTHFIPAFSRRSVYISAAMGGWESYCERSREFWESYFSGSKETVLNFMRNNNIDYILVDRKLLRLRNPTQAKRCRFNILGSLSPYLNRKFEDPAWSWKDRFYLVSLEKIKEPDLSSFN